MYGECPVTEAVQLVIAIMQIWCKIYGNSRVLASTPVINVLANMIEEKDYEFKVIFTMANSLVVGLNKAFIFGTMVSFRNWD